MEEERPTEEKDPVCHCCIAEHARAHISLSEPIIIFFTRISESSWSQVSPPTFFFILTALLTFSAPVMKLLLSRIMVLVQHDQETEREPCIPLSLARGAVLLVHHRDRDDQIT